MERRAALGADLIIPLLALGFTAYFLATTFEMEWEARANGAIIGWLLIALVAVQLVRSALAFARGKADWSFAPLVQPAQATRKRLGMMAITIAFVAFLPWAGLGLGLFLALAAALAVMGVRPLRHVLVVALCVAAVTTVMFMVALESSLPRGPVENLMFRLVG